MNIKTILVPTDFSSDAEAALETAVDFAKAFSAKLTLVHAYNVDIPPAYGGIGGAVVLPQPIFDSLREAATASMDALLADIAKQGVSAEGRVVMGRASQVILDETERANADLVVIGTRGLTGLKHVVLGSTAERIVRLAHCPVVTVKSKE